MSEQLDHVDDGTFQTYLEGELDRAVRADVEAHLAACERCSARLEGWRMLLEELEELPALEPSVGFRSRVLARLPLRATTPRLWSRLRGALAFGRRQPGYHLTSEAIQNLLDGAAGPLAPAQIPAHLATCRQCEQEYARWERLYLSLDELERLRPSPGFARAVMMRIDVGAVPGAGPSTASRLLAAARAILPSTRRAWTLASAMVAAPAVGVTGLLGLVVLHPLLTLPDLLAFITWRATDLGQLGFSWVIQQVTDSSLPLQGLALVQALLSSPGTTLAGIVGIWTTLITAGWILYRNVVIPSSIASRHG